MEKHHVVLAQETEEGEVAILVESAYTSSFYEHLKSKNVNCTPPKSAIQNTTRLYVDEKGRIQVDVKPSVDEIVADGTLNDFNKWINGWEPPSI